MSTVQVQDRHQWHLKVPRSVSAPRASQASVSHPLSQRLACFMRANTEPKNPLWNFSWYSEVCCCFAGNRKRHKSAHATTSDVGLLSDEASVAGNWSSVFEPNIVRETHTSPPQNLQFSASHAQSFTWTFLSTCFLKTRTEYGGTRTAPSRRSGFVGASSRI